MRKYPKLEPKIYDWLFPIITDPDVGLTDITFEDQNAPEIQGPYLSIDILLVKGDKRPEVKTDYEVSMGDEIKETAIYRGRVELMLKVVSNAGAMEQAETIKTMMHMSDSENRMAEQNIGLEEYGDTQDRSALSGPSFKQRADFRLDLHIVDVYSKMIATIGSVPISGQTFDGRDIMDEIVTE